MTITSSKAPIPQLDGFRGVAIITVVIYHMGMDTSFYPHRLIAEGGWMAVQLFFILTGFLLSLDYITQAKNQSAFPDTGVFYKKRMLRIFPLYFFSLAVYGIYGYINLSLPPLFDIFLHFIFLENILPETSAVYGPFWSLAVEVQTYLLFPLIGYVLYKTISSGNTTFLLLFLLLLILGPLAYRIYVTLFLDAQGDYIRLLYSATFSNLDSFGWGIIGAMCYAYDIPRKLPAVAGWAGLVISFLLIFWLFDFSYRNGGWKVMDALFAPAFFYTLMNIGWTLMMVSSLILKHQWVNKIFTNKTLVFIALISYSMYIWHGIMLDLTKYLADLFNVQGRLYFNGFKFLVSSVLIVLISSLSYYIIELPFLKMRGKNILSILPFRNLLKKI